MTKNTFKIAQDPSGKKYIYQAIKEADKNHKTDDVSTNNQVNTKLAYFLKITSIKYQWLKFM